MSALKNNHLKKRLVGFGLILSFIVSDQISKWWVLEYFFHPKLNTEPTGFFEWLTSSTRLPFISEEITSFFNLTMVWNQGISFGLFQNGNPWPLIVISGIITVIFSVWLTKSRRWLETISLSMVIGGAIGNIIDRLHLGAVADFLDFHMMGWHYPAFNAADSFITVGIVMLVLNSLFFDRDDITKQTN